jgi:hypothetical protein
MKKGVGDDEDGPPRAPSMTKRNKTARAAGLTPGHNPVARSTSIWNVDPSALMAFSLR